MKSRKIFIVFTLILMLGLSGAVVLLQQKQDQRGRADTSATVTIWPLNSAPAVSSHVDTDSVELGLKFKPLKSGLITGIRFYKGSANTGTHVGNLWTDTGLRLATATFTGETASGWQTVNLPTPVAVSANQTYVVSYLAPNGGYAYNGSYFTAPYTNATGSLSALEGYYMYGTSSTFPTNTFGSRNYWVDVLFVENPAPPPQACADKAFTDTIILMDVSQSMTSSSRLIDAKAAAAQFTDIIAQDARNRLGFIKFPNGSTTPGVSGTITKSLTDDFTAVKNIITTLAIESTAAAEGTCLECGVVKVDEEFAAHARAESKKVVVLLTDGQINAAIGQRFSLVTIATAEQKALDAIKKDYAAHKTAYYTIGLGPGVNSAYLQNIADITGGKYYYTPTGAQLNSIYTEISQLLSFGAISGRVFNDLNQNGIHDTEEPLLPGTELQLYKPNTVSPVKTAISSTSGTFNFVQVCDGTYTLKSVVPAGWMQSTPTGTEGFPISILNASAITERDFGFFAPTVTPTAVPTVVPTTVPTTAPTLTTVPTGTPTDSAKARISFSLFLHGIGLGGDSSSPNTQGNMNPIHKERVAKVEVYNSANALVLVERVDVVYSSTSGSFSAAMDLGLQSGPYTIKVKTNQYLKTMFSGIQSLTAGQTKELPTATLIVGDINGDNSLNIVDYNLLMDCYSDLLPAKSCSTENVLLTDLNDDGNTNQYDYNLFLREMQNQAGT